MPLPYPANANPSIAHRPRWLIYFIAVAITVGMLLIRMSLAPSFGDRPLLILLVFPIVFSALLGGLGPGLVSTLVAAAASAWFMPPATVFRIAAPHDIFQWTVLIANGVLISILAEWLHRARHQAEAAQRDQEERIRELQLLNAIAESSTDAIFAKDLEGRYLLFNREATKILGKSAEEVLNHDDTALFTAQQAATVRINDLRVIAENQVKTYEETVATARGERTFLATKGPLHDAAGKVIGLFGISRDITEREQAQAALRREMELNQHYLDTVQTLMVALDGEGRITMINRKGCELLGYAEDELLGRNWFAICLPQPEGMAAVYPVFRQIIAGNLQAAEYFENTVLCRDGSQRLIAWRNAYFSDGAGGIAGTLSSGEDISEKKQAEQALQENVARLNEAQRIAHIGSWEITDMATGRFTWSEETYRLYGVTPGTFPTTKLEPFLQLIHPDDRAAMQAWVDACVTGGNPADLEFRTVHPDGEVRVLNGRGSLVRDADGRPVRMVGTVQDITERKKINDALRDSEERFRATFDQAAVGIARVAPDGSWLEVNQKLCDIVGYTREELLARSFQDITHPDDLEADLDYARQMLAGECQTYSREKRYIRKSGELIWINLTVSLVHNADTSPKYFISVIEDIEQRKQTEEILQQSEKKYHGLFDNMSEAFVLHGLIFDAEGKLSDSRFIDINPAWEKHTGISRQSMIGKTMKEAWPEVALFWLDIFSKVAMTGEPIRREEFDNEMQRWYATFIVSTGLNEIAVLFIDITARKRVEESLQKSEQEFRSLAEAMPQIVWVTRPDGWNIYFNQQWVDYTGLTLEESYGHGWNKPFHPDDQQRAWDAWQNATQNIATYSLECRLRRADGAYRWWLIRGVPLRDASGAILKWFGTCTDIEEIKQAEIQIQRLNRFYATLSETNQMIMRTTDIDTLFNDVCEIAVRFARFRLAWIALPDEEWFKVAAAAGDALGYLEGIRISVRAGLPEGQGPTGRAYHEGSHFICNDFRNFSITQGTGSAAAARSRMISGNGAMAPCCPMRSPR